MKVILSIKPEYVERIFAGSKKYEFRRSVFKAKGVSTVIVYATSPVKMVVGEFSFSDIITAPPNELWAQTKNYAGIDEDSFMQYFHGKEQGFALKIDKTRRYKRPLCLADAYHATPPQSFVYVK